MNIPKEEINNFRINYYKINIPKEEINNFRINYYLGNVNKHITVKRDAPDVLFDDTNLLNETSGNNIFHMTNTYYDKYVRVIHYFDPYYIPHSNYYFKDMHNYLEIYKNNTNDHNIEYIFFFGDCVLYKFLPTFVKAKTIKNSDFSVLLNLNTPRHVSMLRSIENYDIPFHDKKNTVLWRGTGKTAFESRLRKNMVSKYQNFNKNIIDINFTSIYDYDEELDDYIIAETMHYVEMLKYKFLLSIEGNDVATNLKWCLLSNSVVLMAKPKICSWFMEDILIPFEHYVPLEDDYSNIEEMYAWCMNNLEKCETISKNATEYMKIFLDEENEEYIITQVLKGYFENVTFVK
jgi:hypothetical protein